MNERVFGYKMGTWILVIGLQDAVLGYCRQASMSRDASAYAPRTSASSITRHWLRRSTFSTCNDADSIHIHVTCRLHPTSNPTSPSYCSDASHSSLHMHFIQLNIHPALLLQHNTVHFPQLLLAEHFFRLHPKSKHDVFFTPRQILQS
jgi:hypothetical protein